LTRKKRTYERRGEIQEDSEKICFVRIQRIFRDFVRIWRLSRKPTSYISSVEFFHGPQQTTSVFRPGGGSKMINNGEEPVVLGLDDRCEHFQHSLLNNQPTRRRRMTAALRLLPPDSSARAPPTFSIINKSCNSSITFPIVVTPESRIIVGVLFNNHRGANATHRRGDFGEQEQGGHAQKRRKK
jgi:hypothetical protein